MAVRDCRTLCLALQWTMREAAVGERTPQSLPLTLRHPTVAGLVRAQASLLLLDPMARAVAVEAEVILPQLILLLREP